MTLVDTEARLVTMCLCGTTASRCYPGPTKVSDEEADVCVLEEPEHLNFFRSDGVPWRKKFK